MSDNILGITPRERRRVQVDCSKGGKTIQSFAEELDVTKIVSRYLATGERPQAPHTAVWGGTMPSEEFQERAETVAQVEQWFEAQPSATRSRFDNDPAKALAYLEQERNQEEAEQLGLVHQKQNEQATEEAQQEETKED